MKIALIQMESSSPEVEENVQKACRHVDAAASAGAELVVLPEFFNVPVFTLTTNKENFRLSEREAGFSIRTMAGKAREHGIYIVATIFEEAGLGLYYDTAMVIGRTGDVEGKYRKCHPAGAGTFEKFFFRPGSEFPVFRIGEWRVGINICYEWRFPEAARSLALKGAELIVMPFAASPKLKLSKALPVRAWENVLYLAACNKVGHEGEWQSGGGSLIVDPRGDVVEEASSTAEEIISAVLDKQLLFQARLENPVYRDRRPEIYSAVVADVGSFEEPS